MIRIEQFELNPPPGGAAYVRMRASQLKDCEDLTVPIAPDAAKYLRAYFAGKPVGEHAFKFPGKNNTVKMLRRDLRDAGIPYCKETTLANGMTARSDVLDVHSLRKTFGTRCARAGVGLAVLQKWMGHSDPKLTSNIYLDAGLGDDPAIVGQIPAILPGPSEAA